MPVENNNAESNMNYRIFTNTENWNTAVGMLVTKFEQMISYVEEIKDEFNTSLSKDELIELKNRANRYLSYLENFMINDYPRGNIREINENPQLSNEYNYNAAENLHTEFINLIEEIERKISDQSAGKRHKRSLKSRKSRKNKKTNRKTNKRHTKKCKR